MCTTVRVYETTVLDPIPFNTPRPLPIPGAATHMVPDVVGTIGISSASVGMDQGMWNWGASSRIIIFLTGTRRSRVLFPNPNMMAISPPVSLFLFTLTCFVFVFLKRD